MKRNFLTIASAAFILTSCKTLQATKELDKKAKSIQVPANKSLVYVVRPGSFGDIVLFPTLLDQKYLGVTKGRRFMYSIVDPGTHEISSISENKANLSLNTEAGKTYYVKQSAKMGWVLARTKLKPVDEQRGKKLLKRCKLSSESVSQY